MVSSFAVTFLDWFKNNFVVRQIYAIFYFAAFELCYWLISVEFIDNMRNWIELFNLTIQELVTRAEHPTNRGKLILCKSDEFLIK